MAQEHVRMLRNLMVAHDLLSVEDGPEEWNKASKRLLAVLSAIPSEEDLARCVLALKAIRGASYWMDMRTRGGREELNTRRFIEEQAQIVLNMLDPKEAQNDKADG